MEGMEEINREKVFWRKKGEKKSTNHEQERKNRKEWDEREEKEWKALRITVGKEYMQ